VCPPGKETEGEHSGPEKGRSQKQVSPGWEMENTVRAQRRRGRKQAVAIMGGQEGPEEEKLGGGRTRERCGWKAEKGGGGKGSCERESRRPDQEG